MIGARVLRKAVIGARVLRKATIGARVLRKAMTGVVKWVDRLGKYWVKSVTQ